MPIEFDCKTVFFLKSIDEESPEFIEEYIEKNLSIRNYNSLTGWPAMFQPAAERSPGYSGRRKNSRIHDS
jgi:hypothetical protein